MVTHTPITGFMAMGVGRFSEFHQVIGDVLEKQRKKR